MLLLLKHNLRSLFSDFFHFRLIVYDLSWATIHACLKIINLEVDEYDAKRVFEYAEAIKKKLCHKPKVLASLMHEPHHAPSCSFH